MPATRKRPAAVQDAAPPTVCDNHPDIPAAHTTAAELHQVISLCEPCLVRVGSHFRTR